MKRCLGVFRETQNSPNREVDDARVLEAVAASLRRPDFEMSLTTPEGFDREDLSEWDFILPMCETYARLKRLEAWAERPDPTCLNMPRAVLNCYRTRMIPLLASAIPANAPPCEIRRVQDGIRPPPPFGASQGWWIKRGDVHNTCDHDVVLLKHWDGLSGILADFASREITHYAVQPHLPGDLIKFYGVGPGRWFRWFYHDPARARRFPFWPDELAAIAGKGARILGLEIFGGDAIVTPENALILIDLNSWPSFARVQDEAALEIARHAAQRLEAAETLSKA